MKKYLSFLNEPDSLPSQEEIVSDWKGDVGRPVVSVCCATYNHVDYIETALRGFLIQKTNFPFEILIRDDASYDGTAGIVLEYAKLYPNIVKLFVESENQFSKGIRAGFVWGRLASGEYLALCQGDDFWTDSFKLQRQIDLIYKHPGAVMSVALTEFCKQDGNKLTYSVATKGPDREVLKVSDIHKYYFHTSTYVVSRSVYVEAFNSCFIKHGLFGDTALRAVAISKGDVVYLPEIVSVYRITGEGVWSSLNNAERLAYEYNTARKLSLILPGVHGRVQKNKLFGLRMAQFKQACESRDFFRMIKLAPEIIKFGFLKVPGFIARNAKKYFHFKNCN